MLHEDQKYIDALLGNNYQLLQELYEKFSGKIKNLILHLNGTENDASDILQEALMSIYRRAKRDDFTLSGPLEPYLMTVCRNKWITHLNKKKAEGVTITALAEYSNNESNMLFSGEAELQQYRTELLVRKLEEVGDICRQLITIFLTGKPLQEVAQKMNLSYGYARKKKSECMARLLAMVKSSPEYNYLTHN